MTGGVKGAANELLLVASIGGRRVALRAAEVHSVIELDAVSPVPRAPAHVTGLSALRSRVLTVIDCRRSLDLAPPSSAPSTTRPQAAVAEFQGHLYALLVDGVEDVVEARSACMPLRTSLDGEWGRAALGMVEANDGPLLLLDIAEIVTGPHDGGGLRAA